MAFPRVEDIAAVPAIVDRDVVVVCRAGARSASAAAMLRRAGFSRVFNLDGGMLAWARTSLPVQR